MSTETRLICDVKNCDGYGSARMKVYFDRPVHGQAKAALDDHWVDLCRAHWQRVLALLGLHE